MKVYVTGASGFIGRHIVARLLDQGHAVVAFTRDPAKVKPDPRVEVRTVDLLRLEQVMPAMQGCNAGIHAAGLGPTHTEHDMQQINVQATRNLVASCRQARIPRVVALTSSAVMEEGDTPYRRCKIGQEAAIRSYAPDFTILRPTQVLGPWEESDGLRALVGRLRDGSTFRIPGGGRNRVQPVDVEDVAAAAVAALGRPETVKKIYVVAGPESGMTYREFIDTVRARVHGKGSTAGVPLAALRFAAVFAGVLGLAAPIKAQVKYYSQDHTYPLADTAAALGYAPRPYEETLTRAFGPKP